MWKIRNQYGCKKKPNLGLLFSFLKLTFLSTASSNRTSEKKFPCSTDAKKDVNQSNQLLLKLGISKLCEVLLLPENVRGTAVALLGYIIQDYDVSCESVSSFQAYQISLCWTAADLLKYKLNQRESLSLAKERLNLDCREEEVEFIYSELQSVAKKFAQCSENMKDYKKSNCSNSSGTVQSASSLNPYAFISDSRQHQSPVRLPVTKSIAEPSEIPEAQCNMVATRNDLMETTNATQCNEESVETDAVTLEKATISKVGQHDTAVTHPPGDSNASEFIGTVESLVEADNSIESNSLAYQETNFSCLLPIRPSSQRNLCNIPVSGIEHHLSGNRHAFCQEGAVPRHPSIEVPVDESSDAPIMHSVTEPSPNEISCQVNTVGPVTLQPACSNPLRIELERIQKFKEQISKLHEDKMLRLKTERDKEIEEIYKKYDVLLQDAEISFKRKQQDLESYCNKVNSNDLLAETLMFSLNDQVAGSPVMDQLIQEPTQMLGPRIEPSLTGQDAAPSGPMFNHSPPVIAPDSNFTIRVARSNCAGIRAAAPHLRASNQRNVTISHIPDPHISFSHGMILDQLSPNQFSASNPQTISEFLHHVPPRVHSEPPCTDPPITAGLPGFNSYTPPLEATVDISDYADPDLQFS